VGSKLTLIDFLNKAIEKYGSLYDYSDSIYCGMLSKIEIICKEHGPFWKTPAHHLDGQGCPQCAREAANNKQRFTTDEFITLAKKIHGELYDYTWVSYSNYSTKIKIICNRHHISFWQTPANHLQGQGCSLCGSETIITKLSSSIGEFIDKANSIHGDIYNYDKAIYIGSHDKLEIICPVHKESFWQTPTNHLAGNGCPLCGIDSSASSRRFTSEEFIVQANIIHNNIYTYDKSIYVNNTTNVIICCPQHGYFEQLPCNHLRGHGCKKCKARISRKEIVWLDFYEIENKFRQFRISLCNRVFYVDGYSTHNNSIYEFYGDFWHGNPFIYNAHNYNPFNNKKYGQLYFDTMARERLLKNAGYNIVSIWENDFDKGNYGIR
jgi:ssDNA-binding Zn-finger/Zn-ribbon topoisomerase 1